MHVDDKRGTLLQMFTDRIKDKFHYFRTIYRISSKLDIDYKLSRFSFLGYNRFDIKHQSFIPFI